MPPDVGPASSIALALCNVDWRIAGIRQQLPEPARASVIYYGVRPTRQHRSQLTRVRCRHGTDTIHAAVQRPQSLGLHPSRDRMPRDSALSQLYRGHQPELARRALLDHIIIGVWHRIAQTCPLLRGIVQMHGPGAYNRPNVVGSRSRSAD